MSATSYYHQMKITNEDHECMVIDVKKRSLIKFLSENEEHLEWKWGAKWKKCENIKEKKKRIKNKEKPEEMLERFWKRNREIYIKKLESKFEWAFKAFK